MQDGITPADDAPRRDEVAAWIRLLRLKPEQKFTLMLVFDHAGPHEDGTWRAFIRNRVLADEAGWSSPSTVRKHAAALEALGVIERMRRHRDDGSQAANWFVLNVGTPPATETAGVTETAGIKRLGGTATTGLATANGNDRVAKSRGEREDDFVNDRPLRLTYRGKAVPEDLARLAVGLLHLYGSQAEQRVQAWTPGGAATPELKRVLGAVVDHPDVLGARWRVVIEGVLANPWWGGPPSVGVVFGPNVVDANLRHPGRGGAKKLTAAQQASAEKEERIRNRMERANA